MSAENIPDAVFNRNIDDDELAATNYETFRNPDGSISRYRSVTISAETAKKMGQFIKSTLGEREAAKKHIVDQDNLMAGRTPIPGNPREMGRIIHQELAIRDASALTQKRQEQPDTEVL